MGPLSILKYIKHPPAWPKSKECSANLIKRCTQSQGFPQWLSSKESVCSAGDRDSILGQEDPLEEGMVTHSSLPAWRIPRTEELGRLQSMGSQKVGHNWSNLAGKYSVTSAQKINCVHKDETNFLLLTCRHQYKGSNLLLWSQEDLS